MSHEEYERWAEGRLLELREALAASRAREAELALKVDRLTRLIRSAGSIHDAFVLLEEQGEAVPF